LNTYRHDATAVLAAVVPHGRLQAGAGTLGDAADVGIKTNLDAARPHLLLRPGREFTGIEDVFLDEKDVLDQP
jgi:hypothetical protein